MIVAHNQPSNRSEPSEQVIAVTKALLRAGAILGIALLDHVSQRCGMQLNARNATSFNRMTDLPIAGSIGASPGARASVTVGESYAGEQGAIAVENHTLS